MRIGIDTAPLGQHSGRGAGSLGKDLLGALLRADSPHSFLLFSPSGQPEAAPGVGRGRVEAWFRPPVRPGFSPGWLLDALRLDWHVRRAGLDVYHALFQWNLPLRRLPLPVVGHVLDLMPIVAEELYARRYGLRVRRKIWFYGQYLRYALRHVDRILAISEHTRADLVRWAGFQEEKIHVVYPAPAPQMSPRMRDGQMAACLERLRIPDEYLLYVGGFDYRKNIETLILAYARARKRGVRSALVLAGGMESPYGRLISALVAEAGEDSGIVLPGRVADEDLPFLYSGARAVFYPSLYEGFGLPVLDAMACGAPVVCSRNSSLPEAAGEAGLLLPSEDEDAWAEAICRVAEDEKLCAGMRERGLAHAEKFSWERAARETIEIYERAAAGG